MATVAPEALSASIFFLGDLALRLVVVEQRTHILWLRLVLIRMQREELVHQLRVGDGRRIEDDLDRFAVAGLAGADLAVRWRVCLATGIADTRRTYAPEPLKGGLRGPESAECEVCDLGVATGGTGGIDRVLSLSAHLGRFAMFGAHAPLAAGVSRAITQHRAIVASIRTHKLLFLAGKTHLLVSYRR